MKLRFDLIRKTLLLLSLGAALPAAMAQTTVPWTGTWAVSPWTTGDNGFTNQTIRQIVHTSIAGNSARVHLSNLFGSQPLVIGNARMALRANGATTVAGSDRALTFGGKASVTIAPGAEAVSDALAFAVPALGDIVVSLYLPGPTLPNSTGHGGSLQDVYIAPGNVGTATNMPGVTTNSATGQAYYFLTNVDVQNAAASGAVVAFGASITDGIASGGNDNMRWPNDLARRLQAAGMTVGVLNHGISGNNFFSDGAGQAGLTRYARDALGQANVKWVIVSDDAVNSLNNSNPATTQQLISAMQQLVAQTHQANLKLLCSTLTPFHGTPQWTQVAETTRQQLNAYILDPSSGCDAVVDQARATSDPADPTRYLPAYNSGDSLHPNEAGLQAIADAVPLAALTFLPQVGKPTACGELMAGQGLLRGQTLLSCDTRFTLNMQFDGNLVLYFGNTPVWSTGTVNSSAAEVLMLPNGNLVEYDASGKVLWQSNTANHPGAIALIQNDGNFVLYSGSSPLWASNTCCH
jgi:lysophospholipase L1-like esterase